MASLSSGFALTWPSLLVALPSHGFALSWPSHYAASPVRGLAFMLGCLAIIGQKNLFEKKASQKKAQLQGTGLGLIDIVNFLRKKLC